MIYKIESEKDIMRIKPLFKDIRFFMGKSVLDGCMGEAYVDDISNPQIAFLAVRSYCFISGDIQDDKLEKIINKYFRKYKLIPSDYLGKKIERIYHDRIIKAQRYSMKNNVDFDIEKLKEIAKFFKKGFEILPIDEEIARRIREEEFINITDDYKRNGIGFCCMYHNEIIGVSSSNIFYKYGIEVNIRVKEEYQRLGIGSAMSANLILECLKRHKKVNWDAANLISVRTAEKLGFKYDSTYNFYMFN